MAKAAAKKLKTFDQYVKEAQHEALELEMPDGDVLVINYPTGAVARRLAESIDTDEQVKILLGEENGTKLLGYYDDAPADVLNAVIGDILEEFGLAGE